MLMLIILLSLYSKAEAFSRFVYLDGNEIKVEYQASRSKAEGVTYFKDSSVERHYRAGLHRLRPSISANKAQELVDFFLYSSPIPFYYVDDYCYARAHEMAQLMELLGIESQKIIAEGDLQIRDEKGRLVRWKYHIAPTVKVRIGGRLETRVIDPSLGNKPLTVQEWFMQMSPEPCVLKDRFEWYDERAQNCVYYQVPRFYYQSQDLFQDYRAWQPLHVEDAYSKLMQFL